MPTRTERRSLLQVRLGPILQVVGLEAVFDEFAVLFLVANDDRPRVDLDDLSLDSKVLYEHVIVGSKFHSYLLSAAPKGSSTLIVLVGAPPAGYVYRPTLLPSWLGATTVLPAIQN